MADFSVNEKIINGNNKNNGYIFFKAFNDSKMKPLIDLELKII